MQLLSAVAEVAQRRLDALVGDLEVAAAGELLELHQREVGLDAGGVAVHQQADGAGRREHRRLGVAVAVLLAAGQRAVPGLARRGDQRRPAPGRRRCPSAATESPSYSVAGAS